MWRLLTNRLTCALSIDLGQICGLCGHVLVLLKYSTVPPVPIAKSQFPGHNILLTLHLSIKILPQCLYLNNILSVMPILPVTKSSIVVKLAVGHESKDFTPRRTIKRFVEDEPCAQWTRNLLLDTDNSWLFAVVRRHPNILDNSFSCCLIQVRSFPIV